jgi:hypothetical protein
MADDRKSVPWTPEDMDLMLAAADEALALGDRVCEWTPSEKIERDGKTMYTMGYPTYHPLVEKFLGLAWSTTAYVHPYDPLPEDEPPGGIQASVPGHYWSPEYFAVASLDQVRRYLTYIKRAERFHDGYIEGQFQNGSIAAAVGRVRQLRCEREA